MTENGRGEQSAGGANALEAVIREGLQPRTDCPQRIVVLGAGMAGLVASYELLRAGHDPLILEARSRIGGRVHTLRAPFLEGLYAEAGAMRIPRSHALTMAYVDHWGLRTCPFTTPNPQAYYYVHGIRCRIAEAEADPDRLGFPLAPHERGQTAGQLWAKLLRPVMAQLGSGNEPDDATGLAPGWRHLSGRSVRQFLESNGWSPGAIEMSGLLLNHEAMLSTSFLELLREEAGDVYCDLVEIAGGMDRLPYAFLPALKDRIRLGARVTALEQDADSVTVHYRTLAGPGHVTGGRAIVTIPFPLLRHITASPPFSTGKRRAIRQLHYDSATKILLQCRRRFWEEDEGIYGGATATDLSVRNIHYPQHCGETGRGVLLASYTWSNEARAWGALSPRERVVQAVEDVAQIHPQVMDAFEAGTSVVWDQEEYSGGAFALFEPGQEALFEEIVAPEGRLHFAGEHTTLTHAWIQGAIASGLRAAREVHEQSLR